MLKSIVLSTALILSSTYASTHIDMSKSICSIKENKRCVEDKKSVKWLQKRLNKALGIRLKVDGKLGKKTIAALKKFQKLHNLKPDGIAGKRTKKALLKVKKSYKKSKRYAKKRRYYRSYREFRRSVNLRRSYAVYKNHRLLKRANGRNTKLKVDISEQRIRLYVNGKVALDAPCTTGSRRKIEPNTRVIRDKRTPRGVFRITEKIRNKRSTIFGDYYKGRKRIYHGDRRKYRGPRRGVRFVGASLKNWMRITDSGIGLHASKYVKRYPATNGCIRLPYHVSKVIFSKVRRGTKVIITR